MGDTFNLPGTYQGPVFVKSVPPELLPGIIEAATNPLKQLNAAQVETIAGLQCELGTTQEQILGFFRIIGEAGIAQEAVPARLVEIAERYKALLAHPLVGQVPQVEFLTDELLAAGAEHLPRFQSREAVG